MNMRFLTIITFFLLVSFSVPLLASAQPALDFSALAPGSNTGGSALEPGANTGGSASNITLINPLKGGGNVESFLHNILELVIRIGAIAVTLMLVYVGYLFVVAQGEPGKISEARQMLLWTILGALILLGSKAISLGIEATVKALSTG